MVGGQLYSRDPLEMLAPICQLRRGVAIAREPLALPCGEIGVLNRKVWQRLRHFQQRRVERRQLREEYAINRVSIKNNVMEGEEHPILGFAEPYH